MKKKKRNFLTKLFSLLMFGIISITLLGSWTYEPQTDTIYSDNLLSNRNWENGYYDYINTNNGFVYSPYRITKSIYLDSGSYTFNADSSIAFRIDFIENNRYLYNVVDWYNDTPLPITFNINNSNDYQIIIASKANQFEINEQLMYTHQCMLNKGSTAIFYEPYGTYINKNEYDSVVEDWESVTEDYNTMVEEYDELNALYQQLQLNYNTLETNYNNAIDDLDQLRDEYQSLQDEYAQLSQDYDELETSIKPFVFDYSKIVIELGNATSTGDNFVKTTTLTSSQVASYFDEFGGFNLEQLYTDFPGYGSSYNSVKFYVPDFNLLYFNAMFSFRGIPDLNYRLLLVNSMGQSKQFSYDVKDIVFDNENSNLNFSLLGGIIHSNDATINDFIYPVQFVNYSQLILTGLNVGALNVYKITFGFNNSYNMGFQDGYDSIKRISDNTISSLRSSISEKEETIRILNNQIADLNQQLLDSVGWKPLFFAIADTPLKTVSNVLGFELFGVNLFNAFVGIVTALALIWLIKKLLGK